MVAGRSLRRNSDTGSASTIKQKHVETRHQLWALRRGGESHALEPGRVYLLGSAEECDLRVEDAAPHHARLEVVEDHVEIYDLGSAAGVLHNEARVRHAVLQAGDRVGLADEILVITPDDGSAAIVPLPEMRQAAAHRRVLRIRAAASALRHRDKSLSELVGQRLREAPWLALSIALHAVLILLVAMYRPRDERSGRDVAMINFEATNGRPPGEGPPAPPVVVVAEAPDELVEDPDPLAEPEPIPVVRGRDALTPIERVENPLLKIRRRPRQDGAGGRSGQTVASRGSAGFRKRVAELKASGLEIMFVFDSTGSMTSTIEETKATIVGMCGVLRALVPDARIGLVTYRDRGDREAYLVRQIPLTRDYWRASNFVQFVNAGGGDDIPEAVDAGLAAAMEQTWRPDARHVIVLAGDAPSHPRKLRGILRDVRRWCRDGRSFVHTLITNPENVDEVTASEFEQIADSGRGVCQTIADHGHILQRVLTLAFGHEFSEDVDDVVREINQRRDRVDTRSMHLVREAGPQLAAALLQDPLPEPLWNALVRKPRGPAAAVLLDLLADQRTPPPARHAVAAALQRIFDLDKPPIDPQTNQPASRRRIARWRQRAERLPN